MAVYQSKKVLLQKFLKNPHDKPNRDALNAKLGTVKKVVKKKVEEEGVLGGAPLNSVGGGAIAGIGVNAAGQAANWGEPGVDPYYQWKKRNGEEQISHYNTSPLMMVDPLRRRKPNNA